MSRPEPDFQAFGISRWHTPDGAVVATDDGRVFFYGNTNEDEPVKPLVDPDGLVRALRVATTAAIEPTSTAKALVEGLQMDHPWIPGAHFVGRPWLAAALIELIEENPDRFAPPSKKEE